MLNGILVIDKAAGMTSADVVYHLRHLLKTRKIGHAGTLDPEVTGVLPIAIGQATKLIELMHQKKKAYQGQGLFGYATDSYDTSGQKVKELQLSQPLTASTVQTAMNSFCGQITQLPPIYSAVKVNGKHLYEYARAGISVERPSRQVNVSAYQLTELKPLAAGKQKFNFKIVCSKGTYVRSLVNDLGEKLRIPAVMTQLRRTGSSGYDLDQAVTLAELEAHPQQAANYILPLDSFFKDYEQVDLSQEQWQQVKNGAGIKLTNDAKTLALRYNNRVKAIYQWNGKLYRPQLMLLANE